MNNQPTQTNITKNFIEQLRNQASQENQEIEALMRQLQQMNENRAEIQQLISLRTQHLQQIMEQLEQMDLELIDTVNNIQSQEILTKNQIQLMKHNVTNEFKSYEDSLTDTLKQSRLTMQKDIQKALRLDNLITPLFKQQTMQDFQQSVNKMLLPTWQTIQKQNQKELKQMAKQMSIAKLSMTILITLFVLVAIIMTVINYHQFTKYQTTKIDLMQIQQQLKGQIITGADGKTYYRISYNKQTQAPIITPLRNGTVIADYPLKQR